jgi:hypothetical protein
VFTVKYGLRLKKELSIGHIFQNLTTRWKHFDRRNKYLLCSKYEETANEGSTGAAPEYGGSTSCQSTWLVLT